MRRFANFIVALTLQAGVQAIAERPANAANPGAAEALQILTRARIADDRCKILTPAQHDELSRYSAHAEVAAAQQLSTAVATTAVNAGAAEGRAAACTAALRSDVTDTLTAARQAVQRADAGGAPSPQAASAPVRAPPSAGPDVPVAPRGRAGSLALYGDELRPYYLERKCRLLSPNQDDRYWRAITRLHQMTVAQNGYPAARAIMHRAEVSAATRNCSDVLLTIKAGFATAVNY